jgi:hypothetical protein
MFRSAFYSYPDWWAEDWFPPYDFSQEFECGATPIQNTTWGTVKALYR